MEKKELSEYNSKELQISRKIFMDKTKKILAKKEETVGHLDFYPEFSEKLIGKTYTNWMINRESLFFQLPFHDIMLVPIKPYADHEIYQESYGIDVSQTMELFKKNKILPFLAHPPLFYEGLDYMDEIVELKHPVYSFRMNRFQDAMLTSILRLDSDQLGKWRNEYYLEIKDMTFSKANQTAMGTQNIVAEKARLSPDPARMISDDLGSLRVQGYGMLSDELKNISDGDKMFELTTVYKNLLIQQPSWALDGSISFDKSDQDEISDFKKIDVGDPFPSDIGKLLTKEFNLIQVKDMGFEKILDVTKNTGFARKALLELEKVVLSENNDKMIHRSQILREKWEETNQVIDSMVNLKTKTTKIVPASIGVLGSIASSVDQTGIIATILGTATALGFTGPVLDKIYQITKPNHVVAMYDLKNKENA